MGIIIAILKSADIVSSGSDLPVWVIVSSSLAISLGLLSCGWRVVKRLGTDITHIRPYQGFSSSMSCGLILSFMTMFGVPVSTTHVASGSIMGTGIARGIGAIQWIPVWTMVTAWIITIPATAIVSGICYVIVKLIFCI
ncbi:MAG TPA: inorganic phosphate transporter [Methanocorpusculum sp.]|nr:inorganic phosphate transporter [Methanocorpusculum sp.]